jgi:PAS domain S-box-containing protein
MAETGIGDLSAEFADEIRVLHVDDDPAFVDLTASFLTRIDESFAVETATSPSEALGRFESTAFDCVVSDYEMPEMNGVELLERIRNLDPEIPFVLFTGKGSEEVASDAISAGVTDYLQKETGTDQYTVLANRIKNAVEQHRSRRALAESQKRLSKFIEQSPLGTIEYDESFEIVRVNEAATEITGYDADELVGGTWLPIVPEEEKRHVAEVERQLLADQGGYHSVNEIVRKDGERRLCVWHNHVVTDEDGEVITIFSQFEDVTEERRRQAELRRSSAVRTSLFETLPVGILVEDETRSVLRINERLLELFELSGSPEEMTGADCEAFAWEVSDRLEDPEGFVSEINRCIRGGEPVWNDEVVFDDGRTLERNYRPIELPEGEGHLWVYYDVTDRTERAERLEALNGTARELMAAETREEVAEIGVEAAASVLGLDANAIHLHEDGALVPIAATDEVFDLIGEVPTFTGDESIAWRVFEQGEPTAIDDIRTDEDQYNPETPIRSELHLPLGEHGILIAGSSTPDAFDEADVVLGELLSVTLAAALEQVQRTGRLRERERELTRQNARLQEFASVVSHDLRNPLSVAKGGLELFRESCDSDDLDRVARAHERMETLIEDLLTLARDRETAVELVSIDLAPFVEQTWNNVDTTGATLDVTGDVTIRADETQLRQLLENLLGNAVEHGSTSPLSDAQGDAGEDGSTDPPSDAQGDAVEHGGEETTVTVGLLSDEPGFYVEDDGPGIPAEDRERVFEYGYSTTDDGTGFGLSIAKQCAEAHGWDIHATDGTDGGARFEIRGIDVVEE